MATQPKRKASGAARAAGRAAPEQLPAATPYRTSDEHLWDELRRIDQYVRAQTIRWRMTIGANKPEDLWGMVHVTDAEIASYLQAPFAPPNQLPPDLRDVLAAHWQAADALAEEIQRRREQTAPQVTLRLDRVQRLFDLSNLERDILLVCLLPELDGRYRRLFGYLQDDASRTRPTLELVLQILNPLTSGPEEGRRSVEEGASLFTRHLLASSGDSQSEDPLLSRLIRLDDRIAGYLLGSERFDARLAGVVEQAEASITWSQLIAEPEHIGRLRALADWWRQRAAGRAGGVLYLHGPYGSGRLTAARAICAASGTPLLVADGDRAFRAATRWEQMVDLSYREAALQGAALYWSRCEVMLEQEQTMQQWDYLVAAAERFQGLTFLAGATAWDPAGFLLDTPFMRLEFPAPGYELRRRLWESYLPPADARADRQEADADLAANLANAFQLTPGQIVDAVASARALASTRDPEAPRVTIDDLYEGCRRQSGRRLMTFARRIEPRTDLTFDDLILPEPNKRQLHELRTRIGNRSRVYTGLGFERRVPLGKGLIAMFTGSTGTGKTMAAELLAREQRLDLYKVDLSAVVSKWVGETEKNLSKVFAEAEDSNAIIFFDEADALFGKRGDVKEAHDRWANMEIDYLLQRVEEFSGVVILASNLRQNIDEAFLRRIHVIVEFPFPDAGARLRILRGMFPGGVDHPPDEEMQALAERLRVSGGSIKNIVVDAAFRALAGTAAGAPAVTQRHLVISTAREYQKLGKPITRGEFGEEFYAWIEQDVLMASADNANR
jgi:AAA+ superfamily predicted ATPase